MTRSTRRWLEGFLPAPDEVRRRLGLVAAGPCRGRRRRRAEWLARVLADPALWRATRRSLSGGVATGLFVGWLPIPMQMLLAAILAGVLRVHVPVSVVMVWFTNPLTIAPLLYVAWRTGSTLLGTPPRPAASGPTLGELLTGMSAAWPAVLVGCLFLGALSAVIGYFAVDLSWRVATLRRWRRRARRWTRAPARRPRPPARHR